MKRFFWTICAAWLAAVSAYGAANVTGGGGSGGSGNVEFKTNTVAVASRAKLNLIAGSGVEFRATNNAAASQVDVLIIANPAAGTGLRVQTNTITAGTHTNVNFIAGPNVFFLATNNTTTGSVDYYFWTSQTNFDTINVTNNARFNAATASRVAIFNANKDLTNSAAVDTTELERLDGVSSPIQTQLDAKVAIVDGTSSGHTASGALRANGPLIRTPTKTLGVILLTGSSAWSTTTNANFEFSFSGTPTNGQGLQWTVSNYNHTAQIIATNTSGIYDAFARSNRTTWLIESNSVTTFGFTYHTNLNNGLWVLDRWTGPEWALVFSTGVTASTNGATREITLTVDSVPTASANDNDTSPASTAFVQGEINGITNIVEFAFGETNVLATGTGIFKWRAPWAITVVGLRASLSTVSSSGIPTVDINEGGTTIISTKLTIDANESTSTTAATPYVISDSAIADDAEITFDIDVAGTGAAGLKVKIYYTRP
jgi:hypothetical protein